VRRDLGDGYELDDDRSRVDVDAVHDFLSNHAYWALGRSREAVERCVSVSARVLSLFHEGRQIGYCRYVTDGVAAVYLADVYVLPEHRGRGLGFEMVRELIEGGPDADRKWLLHTKDAHSLYRRLGFADPDGRVMERRP
jgi:GNAT superfamily N-acetyltransferase